MVMSDISERVASVSVDENAFVRSGQTIVLLDSARERARLALMQSQYQQLIAATNESIMQRDLESETQHAEIYQNASRLQAAKKASEMALAQVESARTAISLAERDMETSLAAQITAAAATVAADSARRRAELDQRRDSQLAKQGFLPASTLDAANTATMQARAQDTAAQEQARAATIAVASSKLKYSQQLLARNIAVAGASAAKSEIYAAQGTLEQSSAPSRVPAKEAAESSAAAAAQAMVSQIRLAQLDIDSTIIKAPLAGWVTQRNVEPGQTIAPGEALITIAPRDRIYVTANYKETQLSRIRAGQRVDVTVDACHGVRLQGRVSAIAPVAQSVLTTLPSLNAPSTFVKVAQRIPVRVSLPRESPNCPLRPGMSVETAIYTK